MSIAFFLSKVSRLHAVSAENDERADCERDSGNVAEAVEACGDHGEHSFFALLEVACGKDFHRDERNHTEPHDEIKDSHDWDDHFKVVLRLT